MADTLENSFSQTGTATSEIACTGTISSAEVFTILTISICNSQTADTTFDLWIDPASGSNTFLYQDQSLPGQSTFIHNSKIVMLAGDVLKISSSVGLSGDGIQVAASYLKQTSVSTSSDNLSRTLVAQTGTSQSVLMTSDAADTKTVLSFTICNQNTTTDTTFEVQLRKSDNDEFLLYKNVALPAKSTFEHTDKIILQDDETIYFDQADSLDISLICSYLVQP